MSGGKIKASESTGTINKKPNYYLPDVMVDQAPVKENLSISMINPMA
jgi:hypothetical protein